MPTHRDHVLAPEQLDRDVRARTLQRVLEVLTDAVHQFETDIPLDRSGDWPASVRAAADHLVRISPDHGRRDPWYARTRVLARRDPATWAALTTFAPYAYDATAWDDAGHALASMADEGVAVFQLTEAQRALVATAVLPLELVPLPEPRRRWPGGWWRPWRG